MNPHRRSGEAKNPIGNWQLGIGNPKYWRSLDELTGLPEFEQWLHAEFPLAASEWASRLHRRDFLRLMGGSLALAGLGACTKQPIEKIVPYVKQPEEIVVGKPLQFATATSFGGYGQGIIVRSNDGRPTKIEGNPDHPASLGGTSIWGQADLLDLYDPNRAQSVTRAGEISTWEKFLQELNTAIDEQLKAGGAGVRILTQTITSPTLAIQLRRVLQKFPNARWHQWDPLCRDNVYAAGAAEQFGAENIYSFADAAVIVALDSDFLYMHPAALRHARDFASARRVTDQNGAGMNRLYVAEPTPTITGANADHRLAIAAADVEAVANQLAAELRIVDPSAAVNLSPAALDWVRLIAQDLDENRGSAVVIAGDTQPSAVHVLVKKINAALGNIGVTISQRPPVVANPVNQLNSLHTLIAEMNGGGVELLIILGGNPVFDTPVDMPFASALEKVKARVHHSLYENETSSSCHWHIPATHFLESWSDTLAFDGAATIIQPLIEPLYAGVSAHSLVEALVQQPIRSAHDIVMETWRSARPSADFERRWRQALNRGVTAELPNTAQSTGSMPQSESTFGSGEALEILFRADLNILDGRYASNPWLQELPRPFSKITWDNAALVSPQLAAREQLQNGDVVELSFRGRKVNAPVWILPGQAQNSVTLHLGYGRTRAGPVANAVGFNAYGVRPSDALWFGRGLTIRKTGGTHRFATTQNHHAIEGRNMFRAATFAQFVADPSFAKKMGQVPRDEETLYDPEEYKNNGYAWGMVIDLNTCIGCNACTIACQAENNIPVVGKYQVSVGREMQWIRVDNYFAGSAEQPDFNHQPVPCMHCEHAPCELVCPVAATVHDDEGLNLQVYNRCVGTRYCSNNCPYKVRRFNFLEFNAGLSATEKLAKNPDVTVRSRGVMEKCTYCLQRINAARYAAELDNDRAIRDGEVTPACAQACPTEAIIFGNIQDPGSRVAKLKRSSLNYAMLSELNTRPRTTYLAKLRNPVQQS
jgi:MoCo/4Fe-4S cofactor protein with predicted Tat translocation signal